MVSAEGVPLTSPTKAGSKVPLSPTVVDISAMAARRPPLEGVVDPNLSAVTFLGFA